MITQDKAAPEIRKLAADLAKVLNKRQSAPLTKPEVKRASEKWAKIK